MTIRRRALLAGAGAVGVAGTLLPVRASAAPRTVTLTVRAIGRHGQPPEGAVVDLIRTDTPADELSFAVEGGTGSVQVEPGTYLFFIMIQDLPQRTLLVQPGIAITGPFDLTCDARTAGPVVVTTPRADARPELLEVRFLMPVTGGRPYEFSASIRDDYTQVFLGAVESDRFVAGFRAMVAVTLSAAGVAYFLGWQTPGRMPRGLNRTVAADQLATVVNHFGARVAGSTGITFAEPKMPGSGGGGSGAGLPLALPSTRTDYYNIDSDGVAWWTMFEEHRPGEEDIWVSQLSNQFTTHPVPRTVVARWNQGVPGPILSSPQQTVHWVTRNGNTMFVGARLHGDNGGHPGTSSYRSARTTLHRNGVLVGEAATTEAAFEVQPEPGRYRLAVSALPLGYDTRVDVVWTFRSEYVPGPDWLQVPLRAVTFDPPLRPDGTAPAGRAFNVPYTMTTQATPVVRPSVQVSFDDGATWCPATVTASKAVIVHPPTAAWVSLRATASGMEQTIIRAYRVTP